MFFFILNDLIFVVELFEEFFEALFPKSRPKFLKGLELDGYNETLKLAFEYNGSQHYKYNEQFHRNGLSDLKEQKDRDSRKKKICEEENITLFVIPYKYTFREPGKMKEYIRSLI